MTDFRHFSDQVLVAIAKEQEPPGLTIVDIKTLCERRGISSEPTWLDLIAKDLESQGLGKDWSTKTDRDFLINGAGLRRAAEIRETLKPKTLLQRLTSDTSQRLVNVFNSSIALLALVVAIVALFK